VIRVLNVEVTATDDTWKFQVSVIHNSSSSEETDMRFRWRSKKLIAVIILYWLYDFFSYEKKKIDNNPSSLR
jgi:hypothetical protein